MGKTEWFDMQRKVVSHMTTKSWMSVPHVSYLYEPDVTDFYKEYRKLAEEKAHTGGKLSFNTMMIRVIVEGLKAAPDLNAVVSYHHKKGEGILQKCENIHICLPWMLDDGRMITPVIPDADKKTLQTLSESVQELGEKISHTDIDELLYRAAFSDTVSELKKFHFSVFVRILASKISFHPVRGLSGKKKSEYYRIPESSRLSEKNLISGTVTVSNIGSLYKEQRGCFGLLEIIPPQVFAVGLGAIQEKPGVYAESDGKKSIGIRNILPMCLVFDHRAVDFNSLVPFLQALDHIFSDPEVIRSW